jgi:hypothetical protein
MVTKQGLGNMVIFCATIQTSNVRHPDAIRRSLCELGFFFSFCILLPACKSPHASIAYASKRLRPRLVRAVFQNPRLQNLFLTKRISFICSVFVLHSLKSLKSTHSSVFSYALDSVSIQILKNRVAPNAL